MSENLDLQRQQRKRSKPSHPTKLIYDGSIQHVTWRQEILRYSGSGRPNFCAFHCALGSCLSCIYFSSQRDKNTNWGRPNISVITSRWKAWHFPMDLPLPLAVASSMKNRAKGRTPWHTSTSLLRASHHLVLYQHETLRLYDICTNLPFSAITELDQPHFLVLEIEIISYQIEQHQMHSPFWLPKLRKNITLTVENTIMNGSHHLSAY